MTTPKNTLSKGAAELEAFFAAKEIDTAPAWRPEPGDHMIGTVIGFRIGTTSDYDDYPIVIYKTDEGATISVHAFHTLLRERLQELGTKKGVRQILHYGGKQKKANPTEAEKQKGLDEYHMYYVQNADALVNGGSTLMDEMPVINDKK